MAEKEKKEKKTPSQNAPQDGVFTLEGVRFLVELMKENNVSELDWEQGDARLKLRRGAVAPVVAAKYGERTIFFQCDITFPRLGLDGALGDRLAKLAGC